MLNIVPNVSIVIPVYNAGPFIEECIQSLISQTLINCEFIFVNDGSKDNSAGIIEAYSKKDNRIILINQHNQGISIARNAGVNKAKGEYIGFLDNDDYVKADMFEVLYTRAKQHDVDIVISKTILGRDNKYIIKESVYPADEVYNTAFIQDNIIPDLLKREDLFAVWNKIYRRSLVEQYAVRFPDNRNIEEDSMFNLQAFNKAKKVEFIDYSGYYYRDVAVNESRKFIERDYFQRAVERYYFDYKKEIGLTINNNELDRLKALRLLHRVFYLVFRCATDKNSTNAVRNAYIKKMVTNADVKGIVSRYSKHDLEVYGMYQKYVFDIIQQQTLKKLTLLTFAIGMVYSPRLSEMLRLLNKK